MKRLFLRYINGLAAIVCVVLIGFASVISQSVQDNPSRGSKVGNSYAVGDFETINLTNGNLMLNFPVGSLPAGRGGVSGGLSLVYNSKLYDMQTHRILDTTPPPGSLGPVYFNKRVIVPSTTGGWRFASGYNLESENRMESYGENAPSCTNEGTSQPFYYVNTFRHKLFVVSPDGGKHEMIPYGYDDYLDDGFYQPKYDGTAYLCGTGYVNLGTPITYYSIDGTYMRLEVAAYGSSWTLYFADGGKATSDEKVYDRNGNYVQTSGTYTQPNVWTADDVTDQFSRSVNRSIDTNGDTLITSKGVAGEDVVWRIKWKQVWVSKTYQSCDVLDTSCEIGHFRTDLDVSAWMVDEIVQPEQLGGGSYVFEYNGSDISPSGETYGWGDIKKITLPSGAYVTHDYDLDDQDGPEDFNDTKKILRNHVVEKNLTYDLEYDGASTPTTETWGYSVSDVQGSMSFPNGAATSELFESTETQPPTLPMTEPLPLPWNSGLTYETTNPDGSKVEKIWAQNIPASTSHMNGFAAFNPYVKTEFTSIKSGGSYTLTAIKDYTYDKNGNVTEVKEYDWMPYSTAHPGSGVPSSVPSGASSYLKRITRTEYFNDTPAASSTTYTDADSYHLTSSERLLRLPKSVTILDASETTKSRSEFIYDYTNYDSSNTKGGNATITRNWDSTKNAVTNPLTDSNSIKTQATYNSYGMPLTTTDANGNVTSITYGNITCPGGTVTDLYPTLTEAAYGTEVARTFSAVYDCYSGLVTSATDEDNDVTTATVYDDLGRPTIVKSAYGTALESWTQTIYDDEERRVIVKSDLEEVGDGKKVAIQHFDQLGRVRLSRTLENSAIEDPTNEQHGIKVQTRYKSTGTICPWDDATGDDEICSARLVSNPYRANYSYNADTESTMGWTVTRAQNNGKRSEVETYGGATLPKPFVASGFNTNTSGAVKTEIDSNATTVTDQAGKLRRSIANALGQLIRVDEPNGSNQLGDVSSPNQPTHYFYNTLGKMIHVEQGDQDRYFMYDSLGRMLRVRQPEQDVNTALNTSGNPDNNSWTAGFMYDNGGNVLTATDAKNVTITNAYDALGRVTQRSYNDSPQTPTVTFTYDEFARAKGALTKVSSSVSESRYTVFDEIGRLKEFKQITDGTTYTSTYEYNFAGALIKETYPSGREVKNDFDANGDISRIFGKATVSATERTYANSFTYFADGRIEKLRLGNGLWEAAKSNARLQVTEFTLGHGPTTGDLWKLNIEY